MRKLGCAMVVALGLLVAGCGGGGKPEKASAGDFKPVRFSEEISQQTGLTTKSPAVQVVDMGTPKSGSGKYWVLESPTNHVKTVAGFKPLASKPAAEVLAKCTEIVNSDVLPEAERAVSAATTTGTVGGAKTTIYSIDRDDRATYWVVVQ